MSNSSPPIRSYNNAVAIITGGASGLGRAIAECLAKQGCEVILADRQIELATEVSNGIIAAGGKASAVELDVRNAAAFETVIQETRDRTGRIDYVFNNAGIGIGGETFEMTIDDWDHMIDVNIRGVAYGTHAAYAVMKEQGYGHIINTASMAGLIPTPLLTAYGMSKHAVVGLSTSLRAEAKPYGVRVSAMCPGLIQTAILSGGKYGRFLGTMEAGNVKRLIERLNKPLDANKFAKRSVRAIAKNRSLIIVPWYWRFIWAAYRISAPFFLGTVTWTTQRARKEITKIADKAD